MGSLVGFAIGALAMWYQPVAWRLATLGIAIAVAIIASGAAERQMGQHDPGAVVIDEVVGMWAVLVFFPGPAPWPLAGVLAFLLFRAFDVFKPPPLKWLAMAPGGWGIVLDDLGASFYTWLSLSLLVRVLMSVPLAVF
jgi:phosphatidylglycerophosphatase A